MDNSLISKLLMFLGLIMNLSGALMLSIPTVGGAAYIGKLFKQSRGIFSFLSKIITVIFYAVIIVAALLWMFGSAFIMYSNEFEAQSLASIFKLYLTSVLGNMINIGYLLIPIFFLHILILFARKVDQFFCWLSADKLVQKEKERRIGWFGILILMAGFIVQFIRAMFY